MIKKFVTFVWFFVFAATVIKGQTTNQRLDSLLKAYNEKGQFDGSILIGRDNKVLFRHQYGIANRQFNVPISASTRFPIGSITKLYTAILTLQLQEEHKLDINNPVSSYISGLLPISSRKITIRQLLIHTSGLPKEKVAAYQTKFSLREFLEKNIKDTLLTDPGSRYEYNNVNYILLGAVIEAVTHQTWQNVLTQKIILPLNLQNTGVIKTDSIISNLAYGYHNYAFGDLPAKPLRNDGFIYMDNYATAGALFTTPEELFKLHTALMHNQLLSKASTQLMYTPVINFGQVDQSPNYVTLGSYTRKQSFRSSKAVDVIERTGNINGFNAIYIQLPATKEAIIICCNTDAGDLSKIANEILNIWMNQL